MNIPVLPYSKELPEEQQEQRNSVLTQDNEGSFVNDAHLEEFKKNVEISRSRLVEIIDNGTLNLIQMSFPQRLRS
jgi:hypothetical protein